MRIAILLLIGALGCGSATPEASAPPPPPPQGFDAGAPDAGPMQCHLHAAAIEACRQRGPNFAYGRPYPIRCKGTAPTPEEQQHERELAAQTPCQCYDQAAYRQRQHMCSMVP